MDEPTREGVEASHSAADSASTRIEFLVVAGFIGVSLALLSLVFISAYSATRAATLSEQVQRAEKLSVTLHEIVINLMRVEVAALRQQNNRSLAGYTELATAVKDVKAGVLLLDATVATQPLLRERVSRLRQLTQTELGNRNSVETHIGRPPAAEAREVHEAGALTSGQLHTGEIRSVATEMMQYQSFVIQRLREEEHRSDRLSEASFIGIVTAMIITFIALCWRVDQSFKLQTRLRKAESATQQELEARVSVRTSELRDANVRLHAENLERQRIEAMLTEHQTKIRMLLAHQGSRIEEERKHIAREVHDGLAQDIYALRIDLCRLNACAGPQHMRLGRRLKEGIEQIDRLIGNVRAVINNLRPEVLDLGLVAALRWHLQEFERRSGLSTRFSTNVNHVTLDDSLGIALFRIFQEATANILRHADATSVAVKLVFLKSELVLQISDDGLGFDIEAARKAGSLGLLGIAERASAVNAAIDIFSNIGNGTTIRVRVIVPALETN